GEGVANLGELHEGERIGKVGAAHTARGAGSIPQQGVHWRLVEALALPPVALGTVGELDQRGPASIDSVEILIPARAADHAAKGVVDHVLVAVWRLHPVDLVVSGPEEAAF